MLPVEDFSLLLDAIYVTMNFVKSPSLHSALNEHCSLQQLIYSFLLCNYNPIKFSTKSPAILIMEVQVAFYSIASIRIKVTLVL